MPILVSTPTELTGGELRDLYEHEEAVSRLGPDARPEADEEDEAVSALIYEVMQYPKARKVLCDLVDQVYVKYKLPPRLG